MCGGCRASPFACDDKRVEETPTEQDVAERAPERRRSDDWISYAFFAVVALIGGACYLITGWGA